jgi:hypothetical protein
VLREKKEVSYAHTARKVELLKDEQGWGRLLFLLSLRRIYLKHTKDKSVKQNLFLEAINAIFCATKIRKLQAFLYT